MLQRRSERRRRMSAGYKWAMYVLLVLCAPIGLLMMWSKKCQWDSLVKTGVSLLIVVIAVTAVSFAFPAPQWEPGGIELVGIGTEKKVYGPPLPTELAKSVSVQPSSIVINIEEIAGPTPVPIYVYCNAGGRQYHSAECEYVYAHTPRVTLLEALNGGYSKCMKCSAPYEYEVNN